jgi:hypothetical protein
VLELDAGVSTDRGAKKLVVLPEIDQHPRIGGPAPSGTLHVGEQQHHRLDNRTLRRPTHGSVPGSLHPYRPLDGASERPAKD